MALFPVTVAPKRGIFPGTPSTQAAFTADAVISETSVDTLQVTVHPVEQGSNISDHAYKNPAALELEYVWSPSSSQNIGGDPSYLTTIYANLLLLQSNRTLCDIFTGQRVYSNMIIQSLSKVTSSATENLLAIRIHCQEILIATTRTVTVSPVNQSFPEKTNGVTNNGSQQLQPATSFTPLPAVN